MLQKEFNDLDISIKTLNKELESIYKTLYSILSHPAKNYDLTFKKQIFNIQPPMDKKDEKRIHKLKRKYLMNILNYVLQKRVKNLVGDSEYFPQELFEIWYAFSMGEDPKDHQMKKSDIKNILEVQDERYQEYGNQRPLDDENYQVVMQDVNKVKEEDFLKG